MNSHSRRLWLLPALTLLGLQIEACNTDKILDVRDPDIIPDANSAAGAIAMKNGVILRLTQATNGIQGPDALFAYSGMLADEYNSGDTFIQRNTMDQRIWDPTNTFGAGPFRSLSRVRVEGQAAIAALRKYSPTPASNVGLMFALIGYSENLAGELYCNGIPLSSLSGSTVVYGDPLTDDSVFTIATASADSALANRAGSADSVRVKQLAAVVKGRALLNRGQFAAAATAVAAVVDTFHYDVAHSTVSTTNQIWALNNNARRYTMGDREGTNGLPFYSANDPRLPRAQGTKNPDDLIFDTAYPFFVIRQGIWGPSTSVKIATGIEARLIEAEAALKILDYTTWLNKLNALRANAALLPVPQTGFTAGPALTPLVDPGASPNDTLRVNLMFRERAFWMYSTGHRLGDLRRLVRQWARAIESVYPTGAWFKGGNYGDATMLPIPFDEQNNPKFVQCLDRNP